MAKRITKDALFDEFVSATVEMLPLFEQAFSLEDGFLSTAILGAPVPAAPSSADERAFRDRLARVEGWAVLSALYDYAYEGVVGAKHEFTEDLVIHGAEILSLLATENSEPSPQAFAVIAAADGRHALDQGEDVELRKLALLANVDERTVRNAVSAGDLSANKVMGSVFVPNQSARAWLQNRKGFKATKLASSSLADFDDIHTPGELGAYLIDLRERNGIDFSDGKFALMDRSMDLTDILILETGVFRWSLDACPSFADFYGIDRQVFLMKIMEIFFADQLRMIEKALPASQEAQ